MMKRFFISVVSFVVIEAVLQEFNQDVLQIVAVIMFILSFFWVFTDKNNPL